MPQSPTPTHATQIGLTMNLAGFTIAFGQDAAQISDADADGNFRMYALVQWDSTVHLPPCIAQRLYEALGAALADYERKYGDMPKDPDWKRPGASVSPLALVREPQAQPPSPGPAPEAPASGPSPAFVESLDRYVRSLLAPTKSPPAGSTESGQSGDEPDPPAAA